MFGLTQLALTVIDEIWFSRTASAIACNFYATEIIFPEFSIFATLFTTTTKNTILNAKTFFILLL